MKLVLAAAPTVVHFLIGKLQELTNSCQNIFEKLLFSKCYTGLSVQKQKYLKYFARSSLLHQHERQKLLHAGASSVFFFLIGKLHDLTSSCSKIFKKLFFLKCYTALSIPKTRILETFGKKSDFLST